VGLVAALPIYCNPMRKALMLLEGTVSSATNPVPENFKTRFLHMF
jgi:hypothetical protein